MHEKEEQERWQKYMALMAWGTFKALRPKVNVPLYKAANSTETQDSRTGREILEELREKMRQRMAAREVKKQNETL